MKKLKPSQIKTNGNVRRDLGDLTSLIASFKGRLEQGYEPIIQPLVVNNDGVLLAGHRRLAAAKQAGLKEVPVVVVATNADDIASLQLIENFERKDLTPGEVAACVAKEIQRRGFRMDHEQAVPHGLDEVAADIASKTGRTKKWVLQMARLAYLPKWAGKLLESDNLSVPQALIILALPPMKQEKLERDYVQFKRLEKPGDQVVTSDLQSFVEKAFGKSLKDAPFPLDEPVAGEIPCVGCQWNSDTVEELIPGGAKGVCRLAECYRKKCQAVSTELKERELEKKPLPFVGYASPGMAYGDSDGTPAEVKGLAVVDKVSKNYLQADLLAVKAGKKAVYYGIAVVRAAEGKPAKAVLVHLGQAKKKDKQEQDVFPRLVGQVQRMLHDELVVPPAVAAVNKAKVGPNDIAELLIQGGFNSHAFVLLGLAEEKKDKVKLGKLSYEDVARAFLLDSLLGQDSGLAAEVAKFNPESVKESVEKKLLSKRGDFLAQQPPQAGYYFEWPDSFVEAAAEFVRGKPLALPSVEEGSLGKDGASSTKETEEEDGDA